MDHNERKKFRKLAIDKACKPWGAAWAMLSDHQREREILAAAAEIVLLQAMPSYKPAIEMIHACINETAGRDPARR